MSRVNLTTWHGDKVPGQYITPSVATKRHLLFPFDDYDKVYNHNKLSASGEGITYYACQNGKAWKADSGGFVSNCPVPHVHEILTHVISNNATTGMDT